MMIVFWIHKGMDWLLGGTCQTIGGLSICQCVRKRERDHIGKTLKIGEPSKG